MAYQKIYKRLIITIKYRGKRIIYNIIIFFILNNFSNKALRENIFHKNYFKIKNNKIKYIFLLFKFYYYIHKY